MIRQRHQCDGLANIHVLRPAGEGRLGRLSGGVGLHPDVKGPDSSSETASGVEGVWAWVLMVCWRWERGDGMGERSQSLPSVSCLGLAVPWPVGWEMVPTYQCVTSRRGV